MRARTDPTYHHRTILLFGFGALVLLSIAGAGMITAALAIQASAQAYIAGESHWSKSTITVIHQLDRFARSGNRANLWRARRELAVPLGDLAARLAMERSPPDEEAARAGFLAGGNAPEDIRGMIWLYRYFSWTPFFSEAIRYWRASDPHVLRLAEIADELEARHAAESGFADDAQDLREEIARIGEAAAPLADGFSSALMEGARQLRTALSVLAAVVAVLFAGIAYAVFHRLAAWLGAHDRRFHAAFDQAGVGMAQVGLDGRILDANQALCAAMRMPVHELAGMHLRDITHPEDLPDSVEQGQRLIAGKANSFTARMRFFRGDGSVIWAKLTAAVIHDARNRAEHFIWIVEDLTESQELSAKLVHRERHDDLTGLFSRREIERRLVLALEHSHRDHVAHVLCFIDVDRFKVINDSCGHLAGDQMLKQFAEAIRGQIRDVDVLGRLGADQFALVLHNTALSVGHSVSERLRRELSEFIFQWEDRHFRLTVTIGLAEITVRVRDITALLRAADTACRLAKHEGGNRIHAYTETDTAVAEHYSALEWLNTIRKALADDRLTLAAQIMRPLSLAQGFHYEVLVRLKGENGEIYNPGMFLPAAERYGLATAIDKRVLEKTLAFLSANPVHTAGLERCHINASGQSISSEEYREFVVDAIRRSDVPGHKLCFEVTETAAMGSLRNARAFFDTIQALGCCIALDDFGSGLSSFGYLKSLPAKILKIDGIFVRDITTDAHDFAVVRAINDVAKVLGKQTVAEFVESAEAVDMLRSIGVDFAQGYAVHRPCPLEDLLDEQMRLHRG